MIFIVLSNGISSCQNYEGEAELHLEGLRVSLRFTQFVVVVLRLLILSMNFHIVVL